MCIRAQVSRALRKGLDLGLKASLAEIAFYNGDAFPVDN